MLMKIQSKTHLAVVTMLVIPFAISMAQGPGKGGDGKGRREGGPQQGRAAGPAMQKPEFSELDSDKSGDVSKSEWIAFHVKAAEERADRAFARVAGEDDKISETELDQTMTHRGGGEGTRAEGRRPGGDRGAQGKDGKGAKGEKGGKGGKGGKGETDTASGVTPKRPQVEE